MTTVQLLRKMDESFLWKNTAEYAKNRNAFVDSALKLVDEQCPLIKEFLCVLVVHLGPLSMSGALVTLTLLNRQAELETKSSRWLHERLGAYTDTCFLQQAQIFVSAPVYQLATERFVDKKALPFKTFLKAVTKSEGYHFASGAMVIIELLLRLDEQSTAPLN